MQGGGIPILMFEQQERLLAVYVGEGLCKFAKLFTNYGLALKFDFFQPMKQTWLHGRHALSRFKLPMITTIQMGKCNRNWNNTKYGKRTEMPKWIFKTIYFGTSGIVERNMLSSILLTFRAALLSTSSDLPASRQLCGIKGRSAKPGCSKCLKRFPGAFGKKEKLLWI